MKFVKKFETSIQFNNFVLDSTNTPNVSLVEGVGLTYTKYIQPIHDYSQDYFTIEAIDNISELILFYGDVYETDENTENSVPVSLGTLYYSLDNGNTWDDMNTPVSLSAGNKIMFKGIPSATIGSGMQSIFINGDNNGNEYVVDGRFNVSGNIMSLIYGDNFIGQTSFPASFAESASEFPYIFLNQTNLVNANNLILPATVLHDNCYTGMFSGCTSLISVPSLPALSLSYECYKEMFNGCTSLTTAPELPATTLLYGCYISMFDGCSSLTTAPELPATTLSQYCYKYMFMGCTSLTTAPELPATTLADNCYEGMFSGCTSLTTAPELPATTLAYYCYIEMFNGCSLLNYVKCLAVDNINEFNTSDWLWGVASSGTFVKDSTADWTAAGEHGIPSGWTVENA